MPIGPILERELLTLARRPGTYRQRVGLAKVLLLVVAAVYAWSFFSHHVRFTPSEVARLGEIVFLAVVVVQFTVVLGLVPACVAGSIAEERERRTLGGLLTTHLSAAEIVLGKLEAGLLQAGSCLATGLPIAILLTLLGGVDPRLVLLAYAGTASMAFFLAGLSILVSIRARTAGEATRAAIGLATAWLLLPFLVAVLGPVAAPRLYGWIVPFNNWLLTSCPIALLLIWHGAGPALRFSEAFGWMIGLQLAAGGLMVLLATVRLRAAARDLDGGDGRLLKRRWRVRSHRRPACGDDPVLWKECHTGRQRRLTDVLARGCVWALYAGLGYGAYHFARPALLELGEYGHNSVGLDSHRQALNGFVRFVTSFHEFILLIFIAGAAAEGVVSERARDTWDSLLATPLEGREILRAKTIGAIWKARGGLLAQVALWAVGLLAGAVHPLGFALATLNLGLAVWFAAALGTLASLLSRDAAQASNRSLGAVVLLAGSFLLTFVSIPPWSIVLGAGSAPFVGWLSLFSYREVQLVLDRATFPSSVWAATRGATNTMLATCLIGMAAHAVGAWWLDRIARNRFDRAVGRPVRSLPEGRAPALDSGPI